MMRIEDRHRRCLGIVAWCEVTAFSQVAGGSECTREVAITHSFLLCPSLFSRNLPSSSSSSSAQTEHTADTMIRQLKYGSPEQFPNMSHRPVRSRLICLRRISRGGARRRNGKPDLGRSLELMLERNNHDLTEPVTSYSARSCTSHLI